MAFYHGEPGAVRRIYISTMVLFGSDDLRDGSEEVTDLQCSRVMTLKGQREAGPQILPLFSP